MDLLNKARIKMDRQCQPIPDLPAPVGYSERALADVTVHDTESSLAVKKYWDVALGPLKQLPMNLFIMYMSGNSISIFPIMMVGMMVWRPIQALLAVKTTFKMLDPSPQSLIQKIVYFMSNLLGIALALYKCSSMGLLPTHSSDWLSFLEPQERMEYSGGGIIL
ncbi:ER membrane protein complex subunit 4-like isoform X2 [Patiria miniata]|uniref:ER membrane protein complex subunit 4 n=1 Tax=Patiria miniata TaxID=46514 RepID=A0A914B2J3_PATMI|nr:ER membrane protein complex subunit 4-like isoform X2 [Patiria miniata]